MEQEIWKPVADAVGIYEVSDHGHLRCIITTMGHRVRLLKPHMSRKYHLYRYKKNDGKYRYVGIHRIMMEAFIPVPDELRKFIGTRHLQVNHKDEDPSNNILENLEWCSAKYNTNYGTAIKRRMETRNMAGTRGATVRVNQLSQDGDLIRIWESMEEASSQLGIFKSQICTCCKGRSKTAGGFRWEYTDGIGVFSLSGETREKMRSQGLANPHRKGKKLTEEQIRKARLSHKGRPVGQYSLDGILIKEWRCAPDAARSLHLDNATIQKVCAGYKSHKTCGGYIWKFLD